MPWSWHRLLKGRQALESSWTPADETLANRELAVTGITRPSRWVGPTRTAVLRQVQPRSSDDLKRYRSTWWREDCVELLLEMLGKRKVSCILIVLYMRRIDCFRNDCYALLREQPG